MEAPILLTHRQLYSIAPKIQTQTRELLTAKRVSLGTDAPKAQEVRFLDMVEDEDSADEDSAEEISMLQVQEEVVNAKIKRKTAQFYQDMPKPFANAAILHQDLNSKPLIVPDPYESYLQKFPPGHPPDHI
jgi:hypothetical protein